MAGSLYALANWIGDRPATMPPETTDVTDLMAAICELRQAWREDDGVYSVRVMLAVGAVIREAEALIDFTPESDDWGDPR